MWWEVYIAQVCIEEVNGFMKYALICRPILQVPLNLSHDVWDPVSHYTVISLKIRHERFAVFNFLHEFLEIKWKQILSCN